MIGGRATEAWSGADGNPAQGGPTGSTRKAMSWDGVSLGTQWRAWAMAIDSKGALLLSDTVDPVTGNGVRTYSTNYTGGEFRLIRDHTWSDGVEDFSGNLANFNVVTTLPMPPRSATPCTGLLLSKGDFSSCDLGLVAGVDHSESGQAVLYSDRWSPMAGCRAQPVRQQGR